MTKTRLEAAEELLRRADAAMRQYFTLERDGCDRQFSELTGDIPKYFLRAPVEPNDELRSLLIEIAAEWYGEYCGPESVEAIYSRIKAAIGGDPFELRAAERRTAG